MQPPTESKPPSVVVQLLDPALNRAVKSWRFDAQPLISIGRAEDRHVEIVDPYVSRNHAELQFRAGSWVLVAHGRNGVLVQNELVTEFRVDAEVTFRLGSSGPTLRFQPSVTNGENMQTLCYDSIPIALFHLDTARVEREVQEIEQGNYFQDLQRKARDMRNARQSLPPDTLVR
jgi:hypothetical protein